ncbi:uncharacterized protein LOC111003832 isoform X1 [Pieris rapae]|uniref:uncharacterized protein LOC111003832 isoform X1 n=2 Tax=Pieris rapae TaxID=64459 RepID=UPI000B92841C|nr:uncharacterized protein LOC111003832 isoform X1 [Pieris rapae]
MDLTVFNDVDETDISCRDKIKLLLHELKVQDEEYMELLVELKEKMIIYWYQPWYQRTGWLTKKIEQNENEHEKFRTDKFTLTECERVHKNWLKFVKKFQVPDQPMKLARWKSKGKSKISKFGPEEYVRRYIISYLARGLERNLHQVFQHFHVCYGTLNKGPYTQLETKVIQLCYYHFPEDAVQYASRLLCRETRGVQMKIHMDFKDNLKKKRPKVRWTLDSATKFLKLIMKFTGLRLEELKYKKIDRSIWVKMEDEMDKDAKTLNFFWYYYLHVQIFVKLDLKLKKIKKKIIKVIKSYPYRVWTDINWKDLVQHFPDGVTSGFLYNIFVHSAIHYKNYLKAPLHEVLDFVREKIKTSNKRLKTLTLNNDGMLEVVCYNNSKHKEIKEEKYYKNFY